VALPERKRLLGRPKRRWVDNIKINLVGLEWGDVDWIGLPQNRDRWRALVHAVMNICVIQNAVATQMMATLLVLSSTK
jgi:hypothetical protein